MGLFLPNGFDLIVSFWACQVLGAVAVPMSPMLRGPEVHHILTQTAMAVIFVDRDTRSVLDEVLAGASGVTDVLQVDDAGFPARVESATVLAQEASLSREDIATVFFTSGTTGVPKGAMQTHFAQYSMLRDMMVFNRWRYDREVAYCALPLTNNMGCTCVMNMCMFAGATMVLAQRWDTRNALAAVARFKVTFMLGPPTIYVYMVNEIVAATDDISSLRLCIAGGAPVPPEIIRSFERVSGARVSQGYGATEVVGYVTADPTVGERRIGAAGLPLGGSAITIVDDDGNPVPTGQTGEIFVEGDTIGAGYWGDPAATAKAFVRGGWLSGDVGRLDEEGYLYVVDRKKDLIISGGFNVYPIEVENLLYSHPAVKLCAVVGYPDAVKGEIAIALIVANDRSATEEDIARFCRAKISAYKVPRRVLFVDSLPTSSVGKILKREIRAQLARDGLPTTASREIS